MSLIGSVPGDFRRAAVGAASVLGGETLVRIASFAAVIVMGRLYGPRTLGVYATVLSFATIAATIGEGGLQLSAITEIGRGPQRVNDTFGRLLSLRLVLFGLLLAGFCLAGLRERWDPYLCVVGMLVGLRTLLQSCSQLQFSVLKSLDRMTVIAAVQSVTFILFWAAVAVAYLVPLNFVALLAWLLAAQGVEVGLTLMVLLRWKISPTPFYPRQPWDILRKASPIGAAYLLAAVIVRGDVLVLSGISSQADVGRFAAADIGLVFTYAASWLLGSVLLADQVRLSHMPSRAVSRVRHWRRALFCGLAPLSLLLAWRAPWLTRALYGPAFAQTGRIASVLVLAVPFVFLNSCYISRMIALRAWRAYLGTYMGIAILAICLDFILGRLYGAMGIASAVLVREAFMSFVLWRLDLRLPVPAAVTGETLTEAVAR